jgi:hypothetical protein
VLHISVTQEYPADNNNNCPQCNANSNQLTSFPIAPKESFTFNYNEKRGVELEFRHS